MMRETGIPPHVEIYKQQQRTLDAVQRLPSTLMDGMAALIEDKGVGAGNITKELLRDTIRSLIAEVSSVHNHDLPSVQSSTSDHQYHLWGGKFHLLPEDFDFPSTDALSGWKLWWFGNETLGHPPYRNISTHDLSTRLKQQTYSNWSVLINHIKDRVEEHTNRRFDSVESEQEAVELYNVAIASLPVKARQRM